MQHGGEEDPWIHEVIASLFDHTKDKMGVFVGTGMHACRWNLPGLRSDLELVAPSFRGIRLRR